MFYFTPAKAGIQIKFLIFHIHPGADRLASECGNN